MLLKICGLLLMATTAFAAPKTWTHFFYISGDASYLGPTYDDKQIEIEDQAFKTFYGAVNVAEHDRKNNYVIFFDPVGRGRLFGNLHVRLLVFESGKKIYDVGAGLLEIDSTATSTFAWVFDKASKYLGAKTIATSYSSFYYYGEHIPYGDPQKYDFSTERDGGLFSVEMFHQGLAQLKVHRWDMMVFHACHMNTFSFLSKLNTDNVVVPIGFILNSAIPLKIYRTSGSPAELANAVKTTWIQKYPTYKIENLAASDLQDVRRWQQTSNELISSLKVDLSLIKVEDVSEIGPRLLDTASGLFVPTQDYLSIIYRQTADHPTFNELEVAVQQNPKLENLGQILAQ